MARIVRYRAATLTTPLLEAGWPTRIQELAYGGLKKGNRRAGFVFLAKQYEESRREGKDELYACRSQETALTGNGRASSIRHRSRRRFEYQGRPYKSLSAIAREITGVAWNGWVFFGLKEPSRCCLTRRQQATPLLRKASVRGHTRKSSEEGLEWSSTRSEASGSL